MPLAKNKVLVRAIDWPGRVRVSVSGGIPRNAAKTFSHDGAEAYSASNHERISPSHRAALRSAAALAARLAGKYQCRFTTNF